MTARRRVYSGNMLSLLGVNQVQVRGGMEVGWRGGGVEWWRGGQRAGDN